MPDKVSVTKSKLDDLANAIGSKSEKGIPLTIDEMVDAVLSIETPLTQEKTVSPSLTQQVVTPDSGYNG